MIEKAYKVKGKTQYDIRIIFPRRKAMVSYAAIPAYPGVLALQVGRGHIVIENNPGMPLTVAVDGVMMDEEEREFGRPLLTKDFIIETAQIDTVKWNKSIRYRLTLSGVPASIPWRLVSVDATPPYWLVADVDHPLYPYKILVRGGEERRGKPVFRVYLRNVPTTYGAGHDIESALIDAKQRWRYTIARATPFDPIIEALRNGQAGVMI